MCADIALHAGHQKDKRDAIYQEEISYNPHAHILLTTRHVNEKGFSGKNRDWDKRENVELWREKWEKVQNREFERKGLEVRVNHESYAKQGVDREPTNHLGHKTTQLERQGIQTDRGNKNRAVNTRNKENEKQKRTREQERDQSRIHNRTRDLSR